MADVLLDDFFEEIIPLASLTGLPGSTKGATAAQPYTYADSGTSSALLRARPRRAGALFRAHEQRVVTP
jgi:hypothetical protein